MTDQSTWQSLKASSYDLIAGTTAGFFAKFVEYPFDVGKVRSQTQKPGTANVGSFQLIKNLVVEKGVVDGLYKGISAPLVGAMAENAIVFLVFGEVQRRLQGENKARELSIPEKMVAGASSGVAVSIWLTPVELIKCRLQSESTASQYTGAVDCLKKVIKGEGVATLFTGFSATLLRETPGGAFYFGGYELALLALSPPDTKKEDISPLTFMGSGAIGGMLYWSAMFPIDTIKSKLQVDIESLKKGMGGRSVNTVSVGKYIVETEGVAGLYRGLPITLVRAVPANAMIFYIYESVLRVLKDGDK